MKIKLLLLLAVVLLLSSCTRTESTISVAEETVAHPNTDKAKAVLYVSINAKRIHYHSDCRDLNRTLEKNVIMITDTDANREALINMEYLPCDNCIFPDYVTKKN